MCSVAPSALDGHAVRCVGEWTHDKVYTLTRYFDAFATSMHSKWQGKLAYIEICSGPGRCLVRETGSEIDGTGLSIAQSRSFPALRWAVFMDKNEEAVRVMQCRLDSLGRNAGAAAHVCDYTDPRGIGEVLSAYDLGGLNLVFIDPTDCSFPFATLSTLRNSMPRFDLISNVAMGTDVARNIGRAVLDSDSEVRSKYRAFLGSDAFFRSREIRALALHEEDKELRMRFMAAYAEALTSLGLRHIDSKMVRHYYYLVFASANPLGLRFWKSINMIAPSGQRDLGF